MDPVSLLFPYALSWRETEIFEPIFVLYFLFISFCEIEIEKERKEKASFFLFLQSNDMQAVISKAITTIGKGKKGHKCNRYAQPNASLKGHIN